MKFALLAILALVAAPKEKAPEPEKAPHELPYTLRGFYAFKTHDLTLFFYQDNADWRVVSANDVAVVEHVGFEIEFTDGRIWKNRELGFAEGTRASVNHPKFGAGIENIVAFPSREGLIVRQRIIQLKQQPYLMLQLSVENTGEAPVSILRLSPIVVEAGDFKAAPGTHQLEPRQLETRGTSAAYNATGAPMMIAFTNTTAGRVHHLGIFPEGKAESGIELTEAEGGWAGGAHSSFAPGIAINKGETLSSDKVALFFDQPDEDKVNMYYAWGYSAVERTARPETFPRAWVSAVGEDGTAALLRAGAAWGVQHALVPNNWEGVPGSLKTNSARYGGGLSSIARELDGANLAPGLTFDALAVQGEGTGIARGSDGATWANPATAEGRAAVETRVRDILKSGFKFLAVSPSGMPDDVLKQFNISRGQADALALEIAAEVAGTTPVFPAARTGAGTLANVAFSETAPVAKYLSDYGVPLGPLRVNRDELAAAASVSAYPGPIELIGSDSGPAKQALQQFLAATKQSRPAK